MDNITRIDLVDIELNSGSLHRGWLNHSIGTADAKANAFGVRVFRDGEQVELSGGSVQGYFRDSQGNNIALTSHGTISGNVAYVTLPQACYNYDGQFTLAIKLINISMGITVTMRIVDGMVDNTNTGGAVAPTGTVPTYQEVLAAYDAAIAAVDDVNELKSALNLEATQIENIGSDMSFLPAYWVKGFLDGNGIIQSNDSYISTNNFITFDEDTTIYFKAGYSFILCTYNKETHALTSRQASGSYIANLSKDNAYRITIYNGQTITGANIADYAFAATYNSYINNYAHNIDSKYDEVISDIIDSNVLFCRNVISFQGYGTYFGKTVYKGSASQGDVFSAYIGSTTGTADTNIAYIYIYDSSNTRLSSTAVQVNTLVYVVAPSSSDHVEFKLFGSLGTSLSAGTICTFNDVYFINGYKKKIKIKKDVEITETRNHLYVSDYTGTDDERLQSIIADALALKTAVVFIDDKLYITESVDVEMHPGINIVIDGFIDAYNYNSIATYSSSGTFTEPPFGLVCNVPKPDADSDAIVFDVHSDIETTGFRVQNLCCFNNTERDPSDNYRFTNHDMILFNDENVRAEFVNITAYGFYYFCKSPSPDRNGNYNVQDAMLFDKITHVSCGHGIELRHADCSIVRQYIFSGHSGYERMLLITTSKGVSVDNCMVGFINVYGSTPAVPGEHADNAIAIYDSDVDITGFHQEGNNFYTAIQVADPKTNVTIHNSNSVNPVRQSYFLIAGNGANVQMTECDVALKCYASAGATIHFGNNTKADMLLSATVGKITNNVSVVRVNLTTGKITMAGQEINTQATISNNTVTLPYKCKFAISTVGVATLTNDGYPTVGYEEGTEFVDFILI